MFVFLFRFENTFKRILNSLQIEQNNKAFECIFKISVCSIGTSTEAQYSWLLAPDAAKFVCEQLEKCTKVKMVDGKAATAETPLHECSCKFHQTMKLSFKRIFAFMRVATNCCLKKCWHITDGG